MKEKPIFGPHTRKVQPRLRMIANGNAEVNGVRSQTSSGVRITDKHTFAKSEFTPPEAIESIRKTSGKLTRKKISTPPSNIDSSVFIHFTHSTGKDRQAHEICSRASNASVSNSRENISTATVPLDEIQQLAEDNCIAYIEHGEPLKVPAPIVNGSTSPPQKQLRKFDTVGGRDVLIGIIDVGGFAFDHEDFLDNNGLTRFKSIWDQGSDSHDPPQEKLDDGSTRNLFEYGAEITQTHMNQAIQSSTSVGLPPSVLEPQSQMEPGSHGTHVASIAAGNRGVSRNARIVGVLIDIPGSHSDRRMSFYDSTRIAHAVDYIKHAADEIKEEEGLDHLPISINISLGTNGHAHDGSSALSRWVDSLLTEPGISISVAAGNSGQEKAESAEDFGFIMGRIHSSGSIVAQGLDIELEWQVVGNTITDVSENEMEIWYSPADRFLVSVKPPGGDWIEAIQPGQFIENKQLPDGAMVSIYNELYHPINGDNYISLYLSPFISSSEIIGVTPGLWKVKLHGEQVRDGRFHAWIERDDPYQFDPIGPINPWRFPSFFSESTNVDDSSVSSLACAQNVISVANLDGHQNKINITSSQGPTRDGRHKPEIAAPGTGIVAANGFDHVEKWISMTGTSMASPFVAGIAGLMLHHNHFLTAAQIRGILKRTAQPLPGVDYRWQNDAGYGAIDPDRCLDEVDTVYHREDLE